MRDCYRFGRFELQCTRRRLLVDGRVVALGARAFDLLQVLVDQRGRTVTKNKLIDLVWPGLVVEENNLAVHVSALRKVLGSESIATIPGRGYLFTLPVDDESVQPAELPVHPSGSRSLPAPPAALMGRSRDIEALGELLGHHRLVTVMGPGGMGKTSVALAVAHAAQAAHRDGACWVDLSPVSEPDAVPAAVAQALEISVNAGRDSLTALLSALKPLDLLLVLDNAEPVADVVAPLSNAVIRSAAGVRVLVTSQVRLKVDGEQVFALGPLSVPPPGTTAARSLDHGAVALFVEQARSADRHFKFSDANVALVTELCRRLDGLPLAIKLAAARVPLLGIEGVVSRLEERFALLTSTQREVPQRHRALQAALDWSYGLLTAQEQAVFRRLGVFVGGFGLELAVSLAGDAADNEWGVIDCLESLIGHSLVSVDAGEKPRYRLLESAREYALLRQDEACERAMLQLRHAQALVELFERAFEAYWVTPEPQWLAAYGPEIDNVRAASDWARVHDEPLAVALQGASMRVFMLQSAKHEALRRGVELERSVSPQVPAAAAARYWEHQALMHLEVNHSTALRCARKAEELYRDIGEARGLYRVMATMVATGAPSPAEAGKILKELAALEQPDWPPRIRVSRPWANIWRSFQGDGTTDARPSIEAFFALANASQSDFLTQAAQKWLVTDLLRTGDRDEAERVARSAVARNRRRNMHELFAPAVLAATLLVKGQAGEARLLLTEFIDQSRVRDWEQFSAASYYYALLACEESRHEDAARLLGYADNAFAQMNAAWMSRMYLRPRVEAALESALELHTRRRLADEGALLDEEAVCSLTLKTRIQNA